MNANWIPRWVTNGVFGRNSLVQNPPWSLYLIDYDRTWLLTTLWGKTGLLGSQDWMKSWATGMSQIAIYLLCIKDNLSVLIQHLGRVGMVYIESISKGSSGQHTPQQEFTLVTLQV